MESVSTRRSPPLPSALAAMRADEFHDLPYGTRGELAAPRPDAQPAPPAPQPLVIEPCDWERELNERGLDPSAEGSKPEPDALAEVMDTFDPPPLSGPPLQYAPLVPPAIPSVDWRQEEVERQRRASAERREAELEEDKEHYPAKKTNRTWRTS